MEELPPPPPPWIETYQREHLSGASPLTTFQGLLSDELILPRGAVEAKDPAALADASVAFVNSMQDEALLLPGEFAQEALWSYFALDYVTQAAQGGHVSYFVNRGDDDLALRLVGFGLKSMVADPHLALFTQFVKLQRLDPKEARKAAVRAGFRNVEGQIRDLDRQISELEQSEPIRARHKIWVKSLRKVRVVPDEEWRAAVDRVAASNPLSASRRVERDRLRADRIASDPGFETVRALCDQAGLRLMGLHAAGVTEARALWPAGPKRSARVWRVNTDAGVRTALVYADGGMFKKRLAVLIASGEPQPQSSLTLSAADFQQIGPV